MTYIIVDTWNGEGYSDSGIVGRVSNKDEAIQTVANEFKDRYIFNSKSFKCKWLDVACLSYNDGHDQGCVRAIEVGIDDRFLIIDPFVNEANTTTDSFNLIKMMLTDMGSSEESILQLEEDLNNMGSGMIEHSDGELIIQKI